MIALSLMVSVLSSTQAPDSIVVFPDRAQVSRSETVTCGARVPVVFQNIPPSAARDSFRAVVTSGNVDALRADSVTREKEFNPKIDALETQLATLGDERAALSDEQDRLQNQLTLGQQYQTVARDMISREMASDKPDTKSWSTAFEGSLTMRLANSKAMAELRSKMRALDEKVAQAQRDLEALGNSSRRESFTVEVLVSCPAGASTKVSLTYMIGGASWTPAYEARADESAGTVDLSTFATVRQVSGEDWTGVQLTLSTAVPSQNATPPDLKRLEVSAIEREETRKVLVRRDEYIATTRSGSNDGADKNTGGLQARSQGLSVQLVVPEAAKVAGDGTAVRLFVGKSHLKAEFSLKATPALLPAVFRTADLTNTAPWPLLPGMVDAFRSTGMMGRYSLDRVAQGGTFTLTFGLEDQVRVKRTVVEELKKDTGLFNSKRRFSFQYRFEIANYGKSPVTVMLSDRVAVSEVDDVLVTMGEKTTPGSTTKDGIITWPVRLNSQEKKATDLAFKVDVPTTYDMGGL